MPNWKKVVTSGSNAELNALTMSGNIIPDTDNTLSIGASDNRFLLNGGTPVTVTGSGTANTITRFQGATTVEDSKITSTDTQTIIEHDNSGSSIFIVSGANGQMLSISDEVGEKLFTVNNSSGLEVFSVSASGNLLMPNLTYSDTDYILSYASSSGIVRFVSASSVLPDGVHSGSAQVVSALDNQNVDFGTGTVTATTFTGSLLRLDEDGTGLRLTNVGGFEPTGSNVFNIFGNNNVIFKAGGSGDSHKVLTLNETSKDVEVENAVSASEFSGSFVGDGSGLTGVSADGTLSSSAQIASDISGSLSATAIAALGAGIFSGSAQLPSGTVSGSSQTIANLPSGTVSGSSQIAFNDVTNNPFINGTNHISASHHIVPLTNGTYDLGTSTKKWRNSYIGTASADYFVGDGSGLTGVSTNLTEEVTVSQTFTNANTSSVSHNFGTKDVIVTVYDNNDDLFVPTRVNTPDTNTAVVYMDPATTGRVVVAKGGHLVSGSIYKELVTGVTTKNITHNLQEEFPVVQLYESASRETFIPDTIKSIDENTTQIVLQSAIDCYVVIKR